MLTPHGARNSARKYTLLRRRIPRRRSAKRGVRHGSAAFLDASWCAEGEFFTWATIPQRHISGRRPETSSQYALRWLQESDSIREEPQNAEAVRKAPDHYAQKVWPRHFTIFKPRTSLFLRFDRLYQELVGVIATRQWDVGGGGVGWSQSIGLINNAVRDVSQSDLSPGGEGS